MKKLGVLLVRGIVIVMVLFLVVSTHAVYAESNGATRDLDSLYEWVKTISDVVPMCKNWEHCRLRFDGYLLCKEGNDYNHISILSSASRETIGYIITDRQGVVVEFSWNESPYEDYRKANRDEMLSINRSKAYYQPGYHYLIEDGEVVPAISCLKSDSFDYEIRSENEPSSITGVYSGDYAYSIIAGVPDYDWYIGCIPTAIGNVIGYWDSHGYPNLMTGTSSSMISEVANYMPNYQANSFIPTGVHSYCHKAGRYPNNFTATNIWNPSYSNYIYQINAGQPTLVGFGGGTSDPYGGGHMTAGVGYLIYYPLSQKYVIVHDAWSSTSTDYSVLWGTYNDFICTITP